MRTPEYLDAIRRRYKLTSDYQVHRLLGVSKQSITHYRHGKSYPADEVAARIAMLLDLDPLQVLADVHAERAQTESARAMWRMIAARVSAAAALLLAVAVNLSAGVSTAESRVINDLRAASDIRQRIHYAQSRRRRRVHFARAPRYAHTRCAGVVVGRGAVSVSTSRTPTVLR